MNTSVKSEERPEIKMSCKQAHAFLKTIPAHTHHSFMTDEQFPIEVIGNKIKDILSEPEIRFCGLIDNDGKLIAGKFKDGIIPFETDKKRKQMFQELAHRIANRQGFDASLGRVKYSSSRREKVVVMSFPIGRYVIMITAEPDVNIDRLAWKIMYKLEHQWSEFHGF